MNKDYSKHPLVKKTFVHLKKFKELEYERTKLLKSSKLEINKLFYNTILDIFKNYLSDDLIEILNEKDKVRFIFKGNILLILQYIHFKEKKGFELFFNIPSFTFSSLSLSNYNLQKDFISLLLNKQTYIEGILKAKFLELNNKIGKIEKSFVKNKKTHNKLFEELKVYFYEIYKNLIFSKEGLSTLKDITFNYALIPHNKWIKNVINIKAERISETHANFSLKTLDNKIYTLKNHPIHREYIDNIPSNLYFFFKIHPDQNINE